MARRSNNYRIQQSLQRQTSVKSNESFADERFPRASNLRTPAYLSSTANDSGKYLDKMGQSGSSGPDDGYSFHTDSLRSRDQLSPRYLMGFDQNFSGHSSVPAISRVSHQPSFESYDSSVSANSWASSNEPDSNMNVSHNYMQATSSPNAQSLSPSQRSNARIFTPSPVDQSSEPSIQLFREACEQGGIKIRINLDDSKRSSKKAGKFGDRNPPKSSDTPGKSQKGQTSMNPKNQTDPLKIIGSEKDTVSDVKFPVGGGAPNIKGLWKRAFQSLRKDKPKREPSLSKRREPPNASDEVDPVYHLLRCAASKSQSTAIATSGLGSSRNPEKMKPNTVESPHSRRVERKPVGNPMRTTSLRMPKR